MARLFGTDGVRGLANRDVTAELALDLSVAAAHVLGSIGAFAGHRPRAVVGRDPRASGEFLASAVIAGLASAGVDVIDLGVLPTPGVAHLTGALAVDLGVMLSASHNPMPDNGIKFFARGGHKLADELEDAIEDRIGEPWERPTGAAVGRLSTDLGLAADRYVEHLVASLGASVPNLSRACASRWTAPTARRATWARPRCGPRAPTSSSSTPPRTGATSTRSAARPTLSSSRRPWSPPVPTWVWRSTATPTAASRWTARGRWSTATRSWASSRWTMKDRGELEAHTLVTTVMSNLGLELAMADAGILTVQTAVGDRYVLEAMRAGGYVLGGEQSGHVIMSRHATTGDGTLTALHLAATVAALWADPRGAGRAGAAPSPGAGQRRAAWTAAGWTTSRCRRRSRPSRPSWGVPAGCCCARPAPNRWSG